MVYKLPPRRAYKPGMIICSFLNVFSVEILQEDRRVSSLISGRQAIYKSNDCLPKAEGPQDRRKQFCTSNIYNVNPKRFGEKFPELRNTGSPRISGIREGKHAANLGSQPDLSPTCVQGVCVRHLGNGQTTVVQP